MTTVKQIIARATLLYCKLPDSGLTRASIEELGNASQAGLPFAKLSVDLRRSLMTIVRDYDDGVSAMEVSEAMDEAAEGISVHTPDPDQVETPRPVVHKDIESNYPTAAVTGEIVERKDAPAFVGGRTEVTPDDTLPRPSE